MKYENCIKAFNSVVNGTMETVHDGWLLKSPPTTKRLWRGPKWRNRWFVLRSGELPGQYFLEYYTDKTRKKLKGKIDLDQCEQVDAGITFAHPKFEYKFMFDIKTPKRVYYLCAETEEAMNRWVDCLCQVCGLKVVNQEDLTNHLTQLNLSAPSTPQTTSPPMNFDPHQLIEYSGIESPPPSASSTVSGPYIPISECITGKKTPSLGSSTRFPFVVDSTGHPFTNDLQRSSIPNEMAPPAPFSSSAPKPQGAFQVQRENSGKGAKPKESYDSNRLVRSSTASSEASSSLQSPLGNEGYYVTVVSKGKPQTPSQKEEVPRPKLPSSSDAETPPAFSTPPRPPRPPKPPHLVEGVQQQQSQNSLNAGAVGKVPNIRRNSSSDKGRLPSHLSVPEASVSSSDPEPSPGSASSSAVSNTPKDVSDDVYDLSRPQQGDPLYSNSASDRTSWRAYGYSANAPSMQGRIFSYDTQVHSQTIDKFRGETDPRISPPGIYSNIPLSTKKSSYVPPAIDRGLKPKKPSDSNSHSASELSPPPSGGTGVSDIHGAVTGAVGGAPIPASPASAPPIVDRNLKPHKKISEPTLGLNSPFVLDPAPRSRIRSSEARMPRAAPSPTPPSIRNGRGNGSDTDADSTVSSPNSRRDSEEQIFFPLSTVLPKRSSHEIHYLDLHLESQCEVAPGSPKSAKSLAPSKPFAVEASVVYKKVDFMKTEALKRIRQNVVEGYRTGKTNN